MTAVRAGSCGSTFPLSFNSQVAFQAIAGTTYRIAVDGFHPARFENTGAPLLDKKLRRRQPDLVGLGVHRLGAGGALFV